MEGEKRADSPMLLMNRAKSVGAFVGFFSPEIPNRIIPLVLSKNHITKRLNQRILRSKMKHLIHSEYPPKCNHYSYFEDRVKFMDEMERKIATEELKEREIPAIREKRRFILPRGTLKSPYYRMQENQSPNEEVQVQNETTDSVDKISTHLNLTELKYIAEDPIYFFGMEKKCMGSKLQELCSRTRWRNEVRRRLQKQSELPELIVHEKTLIKPRQIEVCLLYTSPSPRDS
eukprot:TRINITY_DN8820_c0_g1_i2.p1 TRINITY_DN8820_c0_g1~~TRINITY_DN8820_c0_g1_i2.p1  ORF type:complete len:231 (+),score=26.03 TRINITY_DN8820_c0_g1_i2:50-742(+)